MLSNLANIHLLEWLLSLVLLAQVVSGHVIEKSAEDCSDLFESDRLSVMQTRVGIERLTTSPVNIPSTESHGPKHASASLASKPSTLKDYAHHLTNLEVDLLSMFSTFFLLVCLLMGRLWSSRDSFWAFLFANSKFCAIFICLLAVAVSFSMAYASHDLGPHNLGVGNVSQNYTDACMHDWIPDIRCAGAAGTEHVFFMTGFVWMALFGMVASWSAVWKIAQGMRTIFADLIAGLVLATGMVGWLLTVTASAISIRYDYDIEDICFLFAGVFMGLHAAFISVQSGTFTQMTFLIFICSLSAFAAHDQFYCWQECSKDPASALQIIGLFAFLVNLSKWPVLEEDEVPASMLNLSLWPVREDEEY